jgi:hypothetical protein
MEDNTFLRNLVTSLLKQNHNISIIKYILNNSKFQAGPEAHPASCTMGTGSFPGVKRPGRGADHPHLLVPRLRKSRAIPLLTL